MPQGMQWSEKTTIGEHTYEVHMLDTRTSVRLLVDVGKVVGPAVLTMFAQQTDSTPDATKTADNKTNDTIARAGMMLLEHLHYDAIDELITNLSAVTRVNGQPLQGEVFNLHFQGKIGHMTRWLMFAIKVQWQDFFTAYADWFNLLKQSAGLPSSAGSPSSAEATEKTAA